jgi:hypothetical protein
MQSCPRCHDEEGRPREIPITVTRWTSTGTETTLRCPLCGWHDIQVESGLMTTASRVEGPEPVERRREAA